MKRYNLACIRNDIAEFESIELDDTIRLILCNNIFNWRPGDETETGEETEEEFRNQNEPLNVLINAHRLDSEIKFCCNSFQSCRQGKSLLNNKLLIFMTTTERGC